ncbi:hypothetical protein LI90_405 [Carbonactinospora thermoautotrophica]|uniref:Uncharacterized protein n=1 Tax=Carbonactinospora thermoautotrophica TaxID=1469144 RepID=A0A132MLT4_9ACTN|nr:hypothetical protein LI90_405 [Carbonactinospora thermoautotrophica]
MHQPGFTCNLCGDGRRLPPWVSAVPYVHIRLRTGWVGPVRAYRARREVWSAGNRSFFT